MYGRNALLMAPHHGRHHRPRGPEHFLAAWHELRRTRRGWRPVVTQPRRSAPQPAHRADPAVRWLRPTQLTNLADAAESRRRNGARKADRDGGGAERVKVRLGQGHSHQIPRPGSGIWWHTPAVAELRAEASIRFDADVSTPSERTLLPFRCVPFGELAGHMGPVSWGAWGRVADRPVLATGGDDGAVRLWDPTTGELERELLPGYTGSVLWGAWGRVADRPVLATGGADGTVRLWDPTTGTPDGSMLPGYTGSVLWGAWGRVANRPVLATGGRDGTIRLWDPTTFLPDEMGPYVRSHVLWGVWGRIGSQPMLATGEADGTVRLWDPLTGMYRFDDQLSPGHVGSVLWGAWGEVVNRPVLATGGADGTVRLWDPTTGTPDGQLLPDYSGSVLWGAWGQVDDRPVLATGGRDGTVRLWDPTTRSLYSELPIGDSGPVYQGTWCEVAHRPVLATVGLQGGVQLWEVVADRAVARLPAYRSDVAGAADTLSRAEDAVAVAELLVARTARPPLAIGLFGHWGEGKSHFLQLLRQQVQLMAIPGNALAHDAVRQVWFNAWHYAETDLWASLVAELFAQLARPDAAGDLSTQQRAQSRLMAEVIAERRLPERLAAARARRDELQQALRRAERDTPAAWASLPEDQKQQLRAVAGDGAEKLYGRARRAIATLGETGRGVRQLVRSRRQLMIAALGVLVLALIAVTVVLLWVVPAVTGWVASVPAIAAVVTAVGVAWRWQTEAAERVGPVWRSAVELVQRAVQVGEEQRARLRTAVEVAAAEVTALQREAQNLTAAGQLAGFVTDRAAGGDYRARLGMMTQIREDFQHMATLLATSSGVADGGDLVGDQLPRIDRIILYIDDLDRCPPDRVVGMLEAIHLLLAVELFVVVVAVDPRWLLRAIATHYRDLLTGSTRPADADENDRRMVDPDDDESWRSTPAQYLDKIFQVVLTLPPLDTRGYQQLLRTLVSTRPDQPVPAPDSAAPTGHVVLEDSALGAGPDTPPVDARGQDTMFGVRMPAARVLERVDPLTLDRDELVLLDLLGPPHLITTPRAVKRLANSYGLLTALRREHRASDLAEQHATVQADDGKPCEVTFRPYRAGLVLLGALVAFPALGPPLLTHLHHRAQQEPHLRWEKFVAELSPRVTEKGWRSGADPTMRAVQADQWVKLQHGLQHVQDRAAARGLALPEPISAWAVWVVPVGRLSFPAGGIVNTLAQAPTGDDHQDSQHAGGPDVEGV